MPFVPDSAQTASRFVPEKPPEEFGIADTWPVRLAKGLYSAAKDMATAPGDAYTKGMTDDEMLKRGLNFAAMATPMNPAVRAGDLAIPGAATRTVKNVPTQADLRATSKGDFESFRKSGIQIDPRAPTQFSHILEQDLVGQGFLPTDAKKTFAAIKALRAPSQTVAMEASGFHAARKALQRAAQDFTNPTEQGAASSAIKKLDEFFEALPDAAFVAGTPAQIKTARESFASARGNYAAAKRSEKLTKLEQTAEWRAASTNSGLNLDNTVRSKLTAILSNDKLKQGFTKEELDQMEAIIDGSVPRNMTRRVANLLGGGGGLGAAIVGTIGSAAGGYGLESVPAAIAGATLPLAGMGIKGVENALTRRELGRLDQTTRSRSPLYQNTSPTAIGPGAMSPEALRALLAYYQQNPNSL